MADAALRARVDAAKASLPPVSLPSHSSRPAPASQRASMAHIGVTSATGRGTLHIVRPAPGTKGPAPAVSPPDRRGALPSGVTSRAGQPLNRLGGDSSGRPDLRGTFYGGKQPPTALQRKRRCSGWWLGTFRQAALALCQCMWSAAPRVGDVAAAEDQPCQVETTRRFTKPPGRPSVNLCQPVSDPSLPVPCRPSLESQDSDASDFIDDEGDGEMGGAEGDWRSALRSALGG